MTGNMLPKLALQTVVLLALSGVSSLAAPPNAPEPAEVITAPPPQAPLPPGSPPAYAESGQIFRLPAVTENPQPPPIQPAQPAESDQALPINLATALYLSNARPLIIAFAQASVEEAAARLQNAQVLWLPNLNVGTDYYRHDGTDQSTDGTMILDDKSAFAAGGGATLNFAVTDAIFRPLADRQELAARESDLQTARNDALLAVALAYFDVQQARGTLAGTLDAVAKAEVLARKTAGLAKGLVAEIEVDRARALVARLAAASRRVAGRLAHHQRPSHPRASLKPRRGGRSNGAAASSSIADLARIQGCRSGSGRPDKPPGIGLAACIGAGKP